MKIYAAKDYADLSRKAANIISAQVIMKPNAVLGLATGSTPVGAYKQLIEWYIRAILTFPRHSALIWMNIRGFPVNTIRVIATL